MGVSTLQLIPTAEILASPDQNRTVFDPVKLGELAESIRESGLLQPIKVRRETSLTGSSFVLVAGERRLRAVRDILGWSHVEAVVTDEARGLGSALGTLAENMVRDNPGPLEEARGLADTCHEFGLEPADLARRLGKSPRWVRDRLALLELADDVAHYVQSGVLPIGRGVLMAQLDANRQRLALQAHERGMAPDAFRALVGRLADEQAAETMFDPDAFLELEEYIVDAETAAAEVESPDVLIRETPLGIPEIAQLLEVKRATVDRWRARAIFPDPAMVVAGTPLWWRDDVLEWAKATGRA